MKTPLELLQTLLSNPTNIDHVRGLTTGDVTYVSLNFDNPELHKVLPWTGTNRGPQRIVDVFNGIGRVWETKAFEIRDVVANEHSVAMFGSFTYKTRMLGKEITSPFALLARARRVSKGRRWKSSEFSRANSLEFGTVSWLTEPPSRLPPATLRHSSSSLDFLEGGHWRRYRDGK